MGRQWTMNKYTPLGDHTAARSIPDRQSEWGGYPAMAGEVAGQTPNLLPLSSDSAMGCVVQTAEAGLLPALESLEQNLVMRCAAHEKAGPLVAAAMVVGHTPLQPAGSLKIRVPTKAPLVVLLSRALVRQIHDSRHLCRR
jgi:hypothetical protein